MSDSQAYHDTFVAEMVRHQRSIYGYIYSLVQNHADADDLLQQTSIILWRKFDQFESGTDFLPWAFRIAHFEVLNFLRSNNRASATLSDELVERLSQERMSRANKQEQQREQLEECLQRLSKKDRAMVQACYGGGQSIKQAAADIGRPADSVYVSLSRIRQSLLDCIRRTLNREVGR